MVVVETLINRWVAASYVRQEAGFLEPVVEVEVPSVDATLEEVAEWFECLAVVAAAGAKAVMLGDIEAVVAEIERRQTDSRAVVEVDKCKKEKNFQAAAEDSEDEVVEVVVAGPTESTSVGDESELERDLGNVPGYCWVHVLRPEYRTRVAHALGPWPTLAEVFSLPGGMYVADSGLVWEGKHGAWHAVAGGKRRVQIPTSRLLGIKKFSVWFFHGHVVRGKDLVGGSSDAEGFDRAWSPRGDDARASAFDPGESVADGRRPCRRGAVVLNAGVPGDLVPREASIVGDGTGLRETAVIDRNVEAGSTDGYCWAGMIKADERAVIVDELGPWPELHQLARAGAGKLVPDIDDWYIDIRGGRLHATKRANITACRATSLLNVATGNHCFLPSVGRWVASMRIGGEVVGGGHPWTDLLLVHGVLEPGDTRSASLNDGLAIVSKAAALLDDSQKIALRGFQTVGDAAITLVLMERLRKKGASAQAMQEHRSVATNNACLAGKFDESVFRTDFNAVCGPGPTPARVGGGAVEGLAGLIFVECGVAGVARLCNLFGLFQL